MGATIIEIADAVVDRLNAAVEAGDLSRRFAATRAYVPVRDLAEMDRLYVTVVPAEIELRMVSRRDDDFEFSVDVGIQEKVEASTTELPNDLVDPLMQLAEEVLALFRGRVIAHGDDGRTATCTASAWRPIFDPDHLDEVRVFTAAIRLTFSQTRARPVS